MSTSETKGREFEIAAEVVDLRDVISVARIWAEDGFRIWPQMRRSGRKRPCATLWDPMDFSGIVTERDERERSGFSAIAKPRKAHVQPAVASGFVHERRERARKAIRAIAKPPPSHAKRT